MVSDIKDHPYEVCIREKCSRGATRFCIDDDSKGRAYCQEHFSFYFNTHPHVLEYSLSEILTRDADGLITPADAEPEPITPADEPSGWPSSATSEEFHSFFQELQKKQRYYQALHDPPASPVQEGD